VGAPAGGVSSEPEPQSPFWRSLKEVAAAGNCKLYQTWFGLTMGYTAKIAMLQGKYDDET